MGALVPVSPWLPEDDLLLKNSIEAGASLESLAKGAVQFSRKFTVRELQDRWHSLLYDPVISAEASFRMIEFEHSAPTLPSKFSRAGNSKENRSFSGKRKVESVRSCYYALRKRIRNEPFNSMDLSFLVAPSEENLFGNEDEPLSGNCMLGDPMPNHYGLQESNLDIMQHAFPEADAGTAVENGCMAHGFHGELVHPVDEDFAMQHDNIHEDIPDMFEENPPFTGHGPGLEELGQPKQVPSLFGVEHLEANPPSTYGQIHNDPGNVCSEFEGNQVFHSPIPECDVSFQNLEYSSPLPEMPIWKAVEEISTPAIPVDDSLREKDMHAGDAFALRDDGGEDTSAPGCDFVHTDSNLKMQMSCDDLKSPAASTENYLAELSNSLLNFTNDEELLLMDVDGKEMIDKSYYDGLSLLLSSPNEVNEDHMPSPEPETLANQTNSSGIFLAESVEKVQMKSSASALDPRFPELIDGIICCTLNTEDPDIPCNDDVFLPIHTHRLSAPIATRRNFKEVGNPISTSVKDFRSNPRSNEGHPVLMQRDQENPGQSHASSHMMGSQGIPEKGQLHPVLDCGVKFESPHLASRTSAIASGGSIQINAVNVGTDTLQHARLKEETEEIALVKDLGRSLTDSFLEKPAFGSDDYKSHERNASGIKLELDALAAIQDRQASNAEAGSINIPDSEPVINPPTSEIELSIESDDDDVPYFSDIEAMILDMDLDPDDQDLYELEVSKYQHEDSRRAIIRLEQGANSYMQRAIASHGAFAILCGRYSKHYIKKPEVLLGRGTEDVVVDIDLGREGRANKISRRQAIISMDKVGSFHLKNLGKFSISVNNKEVAPGQSLSLNSGCLIEIRGMPFIFETNKTFTKWYLDSVSKEKPNS
ncbi:uncharacterized protein LOC116127598 isoform X1 [Pistacia vera]|uniref:uncharacterized protein LOC116127598 isoform X1 n=2 Tax=Pistacia vera TaxID=55513 RepID=UPI0012638830|nr:uncharacterized protein LOC116127598 isoform X1 [Pistacia vera]